MALYLRNGDRIGARWLLGVSLLAWATGCAGRVGDDGSSGLRESWKPDGGLVSNDTQASTSVAANPSGNPKPKVKGAKAPTCEQLAAKVETFMQDHCADCHANGKTQGGFGDVLDVDRMIQQGKIIPSDPDSSKVFTLVMSGMMPRNNNKPSSDEIDTLGAWIACGAADWKKSAGAAGAQAGFVGIDDRLRSMYDDLRAIENPTDRGRVRYLDFTQLSNAGMTDAEIEPYRQTVSLLVNSLSRGNRVVVAEAIDQNQLLYRIDLRNYGWSAATWELIAAEYPYAVRYDADSRVFPFDEDLAESIRQDTQTDVPYIQADWLLAHASLAPLYYDVLQIPARVDALALGLGVDIARDIADSQVERAGFNSSGVSVNNRVIERHEQPGFGGALWLSYDFASSDGVKNVFAHPSDFKQDAGEGFFNLPNGLQAYFLQDANFNRLDKANPEVVTDPNSRDRAVSPGLSCMGGCHLSKGVILKDDQVRAHIMSAAPDAATRERVFELYPIVDDMRASMTSDGQRYLDAVTETGFQVGDENVINHQVRKQQDLLGSAEAAATLGISEDEFVAAIDASPQAFPAEVVTLGQAGGTIYRDTFDQDFAQIVTGLGLGNAIRTSSAKPAAAASSPAAAAKGDRSR